MWFILGQGADPAAHAQVVISEITPSFQWGPTIKKKKKAPKQDGQGAIACCCCLSSSLWRQISSWRIAYSVLEFLWFPHTNLWWCRLSDMLSRAPVRCALLTSMPGWWKIVVDPKCLISATHRRISYPGNFRSYSRNQHKEKTGGRAGLRCANAVDACIPIQLGAHVLEIRLELPCLLSYPLYISMGVNNKGK